MGAPQYSFLMRKHWKSARTDGVSNRTHVKVKIFYLGHVVALAPWCNNNCIIETGLS
jgi:hypothetical protein